MMMLAIVAADENRRNEVRTDGHDLLELGQHVLGHVHNGAACSFAGEVFLLLGVCLTQNIGDGLEVKPVR
jgi:hypothetical protein